MRDPFNISPNVSQQLVGEQLARSRDVPKCSGNYTYLTAPMEVIVFAPNVTLGKIRDLIHREGAGEVDLEQHTPLLVLFSPLKSITPAIVSKMFQPESLP